MPFGVIPPPQNPSNMKIISLNSVIYNNVNIIVINITKFDEFLSFKKCNELIFVNNN